MFTFIRSIGIKRIHFNELQEVFINYFLLKRNEINNQPERC